MQYHADFSTLKLAFAYFSVTNKLRFLHYRVEVTNFERADSSSSGVSETESEEILASGKIYL